MVPAFRHSDTVCVGFLGLLALLRNDIAGAVVADSVGIAVILPVQLLHLGP